MPRRDTGDRTKAFVAELHAFCHAEKGRVRRLAAYLGINESQVSSWWGGFGYPTTEQLLGSMEWRKKIELNELN